MLNFLFTTDLLEKKRNALAVFQQVKDDLSEFIEEASQEISEKEDNIKYKRGEIRRFKTEKEQEISEEKDDIELYNNEIQQAENVIENLESLC